MNRAKSIALAASIILIGCLDCRAGELVGAVAPPERVKSITILDRETKKTFHPAFDAKTGRYSADNLPAGVYDVILETGIGRIEGVNLRLVASDQPAPADKTLKPGPVDRTDLGDLVTWIEQKHAKETPPVSAVVLRMNGAAVAEVFLRPAKGDDTKVNLAPEELGNIAAALAGTVLYFQNQADFPARFDLVIELVGDKVNSVVVHPAGAELADADRAWLLDWIAKVKAFENKRRVLFIRGGEDSAKALVELVRDEPTTLETAGPEVFWRVEIWNFRKLHGGWEKTDYKVQEREKYSVPDFRKLNWVFEPALGGFTVGPRGRVTVPDFATPDKLDPEHGPVAR